MGDNPGVAGMGIIKSGRYPVKIRAMFSTAVAILGGLVVLAGYFVQLEFLINARRTLIEWAIILTAFAVIVGIISLLIVHSKKTVNKEKGAFYSIILVSSLLITFLLGLLSPYSDTISPAFSFTFTAIQLPIEASLMALLAVTLTYGCIRLLRHRMSSFSIIFLVTTLFILIGLAPLPLLGDMPFFSDTLRPFVTRVLAVSGARGILIGVALGALTTGLRVLIGIDRPFEGK